MQVFFFSREISGYKLIYGLAFNMKENQKMETCQLDYLHVPMLQHYQLLWKGALPLKVLSSSLDV